MKKLLSLTLCLLMLFGCVTVFASCTSVEEVYKPYQKQLAKYTQSGDDLPVLKVAISPDFAPMEFVYVNGAEQEVVGFDVILANYLAKELGMKLELKTMSFDACQTAIQTGAVDLAISGFSWTVERAENYEISDYYIAGENETEQVIITTKANENKLATADKYATLKIGYQGASLQEVLVNEKFTTTNEAGKQQVAALTPYQDLGTATEALKTGKIDALAVAGGNGEAIIANAPEAIAFSGYEFEVAEIYKNNVILLQKGNTELLAKVNTALAKALENDYYTPWYEAATILAGSKNIDELGYDDEGNKITE